MDAIEAECGITFPVIAHSHRHQGFPIAQDAVDDGRPGMDILVFDRQVRPEAEIDELILAREQYGFHMAERAIQLVGIFPVNFCVQDTVMIDRRIGALCCCFGLNRPEQHRRGDAQSVLSEIGYVAGLLVGQKITADIAFENVFFR